LLRDGLHTTEIADGYAKAAAKVSSKGWGGWERSAWATLLSVFTSQSNSLIAFSPSLQALQILEELVLEGSKDIDLRSKEAVAKRLKGAISSKISGWVAG
jgi:hypothetical protein